MAVAKSADAFRTISEAASELDVPQHVLRHWEDVFGQIRPMRRAGGRRYYRPIDLDLLRGVRVLLYDQRYTTKGVQKIFKENGVKYVSELGRLAAAGEPIDLRPLIDDEDDREAGDDAVVLEATSKVGQPKPDESSSPKGQRNLANASLQQELNNLLERLEKVEEALDEAALALEAIAESGDRAK